MRVESTLKSFRNSQHAQIYAGFARSQNLDGRPVRHLVISCLQ